MHNGERSDKSELRADATATGFSFVSLPKNKSDKVDSLLQVDKGPTILIVDDDEGVRKFMMKALSGDYQVVTAKDGLEALDMVHKQMPDLIVSDLVMPNMDGEEFCRVLKSTDATLHIPFIMLTEKNSLECQLNGLNTGGDAYITKPFELALLMATINNLLESRRVLRKKFSYELTLLDEAHAAYEDDKTFLKAVVQVIETHYEDHALNPDHLAEYMNISVSALFRKIKALTDRTPMELITEIRLRRAAYLLEHSTISITEIAFEVGYGGSTQFGRSFKEHYHMTPSQFRKKG